MTPVIVALLLAASVATLDSRIEVQLDDETTPGFDRIEGRAGILNWRLTLAPKERREVELRYTVRSPKGVAVAGL